jgi:hypothetical protein
MWRIILLAGVAAVIYLLKSKDYFAQTQVSQKFAFCHQIVFMCFVRISEQAAIMLIQLFVFRK